MKSKLLTLILLLALLSLPSFALEGPLQLEAQDLPSEIQAGQELVLKFLIKNTSDQDMEDISSELIIRKDSILSPADKEELKKEYSLRAGEEKLLTFKLSTKMDEEGKERLRLITRHEEEVSEACPIGKKIEIRDRFTIELVSEDKVVDKDKDENLDKDKDQDDDKNDHSQDFFQDQVYYDTSGGGSVSTDDDDSHKNKPKLIISKYKIEPLMPRAGEEFTMTLSFLNTNSEKSCRNIKIFLTSDGTAGEGEGLSSGGVFSPVGSSNTFYIDYIAPGETKEKTITFHTMPTAPSKTYTMTANFEYEDYQGTELEATELIGVPVVQVSKVQVDEPILSEMGPGSPLMIDVNFYNTGRDNLTNFMVSLEGEDFTADEQRYFVGNFQTGSGDSFSTTIYPHEEGEFRGKVLISYEDSTGTPHEMEKEFEGYHMPMEFEDFEDFPIEMEIEKSGPSPLAIGAIAIGLAAGLGLVLRNKKKKKQIEELDLNEDR